MSLKAVNEPRPSRAPQPPPQGRRNLSNELNEQQHSTEIQGLKDEL